MSYALENFAVREVENKRFKVIVEVSNSTSTTPKKILEKSFPAYIAIFVVLLIAILVTLLIVTSSILTIAISVSDTIKNLFFPPYQPNYEEAKRWFEEGNGYLANLSEEERAKLQIKKDLPLTWHSQCTILINTLNTYLTLPNDWDGYDGVAPKKQTIQDGIFFVKQLSQSIRLPKPMVGGSGTVGLYWEKNDIYAEVCFEGDGTFWYYGTDGKQEIGEESIALLSDMIFPMDLDNLLQKI